jgi:PadR family transcriptional regulator PadR
MNRKADTLLPLEEDVLRLTLRADGGDTGLHGYAIAKALEETSKRLVGHGTIYKALARLEERGLVASDWESVESSRAENRPPRRLYVLTQSGREVARSLPVPARAVPSLRLSEAGA